MKMSKKGLMIGVMAVLLISILVPTYAQTQSGDPVQDRDQECDTQGPATRAYGEDKQANAQEEKPETTEVESLGSEEEPVQEQTQTKDQLRNGEGEEGEQYQYQYQYRDQFGQEEQTVEVGKESAQEQSQSQEQQRDGNTENDESEQYQYQYRYQDRFGQED